MSLISDNLTPASLIATRQGSRVRSTKSSTKASNLESEVFTAGNSVVGTVKRLIQFGEPWHVEQILLNSLQEKKYQLFVSKKDARGVVHTKARSVKAYNIAILDPLTPEEMAELADRQIRTRALLDDE